jgi:GT2 family glycosyltransferase
MQVMSQDLVSIVILHLDRREELRLCLESLSQLTYTPREVLIVQNGSPLPLALEDTQTHDPHVSQVLHLKDNVGFAVGSNAGIREALARGANYVLLLNDDTVVAPDSVSRLVECAETRPDGGAFGPIILLEGQPSTVWFAGARFDPAGCSLHTPGSGGSPDDLPRTPYPSDYLTGCCLLLTHDALVKVGLFDERFFLYWEDTDWGLRSMASGFTNYVVSSARIWHRVSASSGGMDSPLRAYHRIRSHLLFAWLHTPHALGHLQRRFLRDIAWLGLKSHDRSRWRLARAHLAALRDFRLRRTGRGPTWLWRDR